MKSSHIRRLFLDFFVAQGHREVPSSSLVPADDPDAAVHQRRHGAVQAHVPGPGAAGLRARHHLPEVRAGRRQAQRSRAGGPHHAASHLLRDARQLLVRRLLQARRDRVRLGVRHQPAVPRDLTGPASRHRAPHRRRGARALAGDLGPARRPDLRPGRQGQLLADGRHRPVRAVLRDLRGSGGGATALAVLGLRFRTRSSSGWPRQAGSSRSGTSSSCSSTARPTARSRRCPSRRWTPARDSSGSRR